MPAEPTTWPVRPERAAAGYLAEQGTDVADRVAPRYDDQVGLPQAALHVVGGTPDGLLAQLDVWAATEGAAAAACAQLCTALDAMPAHTRNGVLLAGATVADARPFPDGDLPRYIADVVLATGATD